MGVPLHGWNSPRFFRSPEEAREQYSHVTPGEPRYSYSPRILQEPDQRIAAAIISVLHKKLSSDSYRSHFTSFGPGLLVLTERDPLFSESTLWAIQEYLLGVPISIDRAYFKRAFLDFSMNGVFGYREIYPTPSRFLA